VGVDEVSELSELGFNTFSDKNFRGWQNHPSFSEMGGRITPNFESTYIPRRCSPNLC